MESYSLVEPLVIGLGVEKAATTWIHRQLESHPEIATTYTKELSFWLKNYSRGPQWYSSQFNKTPQTRAYAEYTPNYICRIETVLQRISSHISNVKFILTLRNPYERAFSHYLDARRNGTTSLPFELACTPESNYVRKSLYLKDIKKFLEFYDASYLHVIYYDEINNNPLTTIKNLYEFIGVDNNHVSHQLSEKVNVGSNVSTGSLYLKKLELLAKRAGLSRKHFVHIGMGNIVDQCKAYLSKKNPKPSLTYDHVQHLRQFFENDISELSQLLGRDLSLWEPDAMKENM